TFTWAYEKDHSVSAGLDRAFVDDISFPAPLVGVMNIYEDRDLHNPTSPRRPPIPPTAPPPASLPAIRQLDALYGGMVRVGDQNLDRPQGQIILEQNTIDRVANTGILVDAGPRQPGSNAPFASVRNLPTLNNDRLVPGAVIVNNVISNFGSVGIAFSGDPNTPVGGQAVPPAAVPFGRIVNNTIYGGASPAGSGTIGIQVGPNAGPTLLNNIISSSDTGIAVDPSSAATTVIGANLFAGNTVDGPLGTNAIVLPAGAPLFVNPANRNFYLVAGSPAIDSSLNSLPDRPSIAAVRSAVGIPQSPVMAPDRDQYGQLRVDDPNAAPPPGLGVNIFKDRGAIERADFSPPTASVVDPLD
ncbi:MAG: right-handed parallel beta-helix repeat-containing protein, partial [Anaerolineae bacterium]|nr:right-handed parallel beta-helix repeat-containing protein [Anaerolineae bacterium]